ncbi:MAG: DUF3795 domain-containing protein [Desulfobacterales bacterium]|nr:DUF3795 domain-containing protein [Desulfobacterales bacterium]
MTNPRPELIAPCGLYCGACHRFKKGKCPGCPENDRATWCKIRDCVKSNNYRTCADCTQFDDVNQCKKFNTLFSKFFYLVFRSDRKSSLARISEIGIPDYAKEMAEKDQVVIKR